MTTRYLTIVYEYVSPERTAELIKQPDVRAMAHSHKMDEVNALKQQLFYATRKSQTNNQLEEQ